MRQNQNPLLQLICIPLLLLAMGAGCERQEVKASAPTPKQPAPVYAILGTISKIGDVQVSVDSVKIAKPMLRIFGKESPTETEYVVVSYGVENVSETRKIDFIPWNDRTTRGSPAHMTDDLGNAYKVSGSLMAEVVGNLNRQAIYPNTRVVGVLLFELPVDRAKVMRLELPAENVGQKGAFRYEFPVGSLR